VRSPLVQRLCGIAAVAALAACSNDGTAATTTAPAVRSHHPPRPNADDGTLVVGAVLPNSGIAAELGGSMRTAWLRRSQRSTPTAASTARPFV
jgi:hypothetical protein